MPDDLDKYLPLLERFDISEDQKKEIVVTVWAIARNFVDRAYLLDAAQLSVQEKARNSADKQTADSSAESLDTVDLKSNSKTILPSKEGRSL